MKLFTRILLFLLFLLLASGTAFYFAVKVTPPEVNPDETTAWKRMVSPDSVFYSGNNWLKKNEFGIWEMYVEGPAFQRGYVNGLLSREHVQKQEEIFIGRLNTMLPGKIYQNFLKLVVGWFNRNLEESVPLEYQKEIYGVSRSASENFSYIAPAYQRLLNYHAAHDIGHAMQNMNLVACTSVGIWGNRTSDSSMLIGRNFDFYMGEEFAKEKILLFVNPDSGYKFMSVTWGGMIGVLSGMNEKGLTITLNAAKSGIPSGAATPVSIISRKILQYASNINEAYKIASSYQSFVNESFMIGSKADKMVFIIEKSPDKTIIYQSENNLITCSNHFQGIEWAHDSLNITNIQENPTEPRRQRLLELIQPAEHLNPSGLAAILRNRYGKNGNNIGMGNEEALNQFVAHHAVIFNPDKGLVWVSANPYQLGAFVAYDLNKVFKEYKGLKRNREIFERNQVIPADPFLLSEEFRKLQYFKKISDKIRIVLWNDGKGNLTDEELKNFTASNPDYFHTWMLAGDYFKMKKQYRAAMQHYEKALSLSVPRKHDTRLLQESLEECRKKLNL